MCTLSREKTLAFFRFSTSFLECDQLPEKLFSFGQLLKKRICSSWSKFFPIRVDLFWEGFDIKQEDMKVVSIEKNGRKAI